MNILELATRRNKLKTLADDMQAAMHDIRQAGAEGAEAAGYAGCWAAVLMTTDIIRIGISAVDKRAAAGFAAIDGGIAAANRFLSVGGLRTIPTRSDALKSLEPNLAKTSGHISRVSAQVDDVRKARDLLKHAKVRMPPKLRTATAGLGVAIDIAVSMAQDTLLLMQAGQTQGDVTRRSSAAVDQIARQLAKVRDQIRVLDHQIAMEASRLKREQLSARAHVVP